MQPFHLYVGMDGPSINLQFQQDIKGRYFKVCLASFVCQLANIEICVCQNYRSMIKSKRIFLHLFPKAKGIQKISQRCKYLTLVVFLSNQDKPFLNMDLSHKLLIHYAVPWHEHTAQLPLFYRALLAKFSDVKDEGAPEKLIEIVTIAKSLIQDILLLDNEASCCICYVEVASYLKINLPFNNKILEYTQFLNPQERNDRLFLKLYWLLLILA